MRVADLLNPLKYLSGSGAGSPDDPFVLSLGQAANSYIALTPKAGQVSTSGDNTLIAAPGAGLRIVLYAWAVWNESTTETLAILKSASIATIDRYLPNTKPVGKQMVLPAGYAIQLAVNEALVLNLNGANAHGYAVYYRVVAG